MELISVSAQWTIPEFVGTGSKKKAGEISYNVSCRASSSDSWVKVKSGIKPTIVAYDPAKYTVSLYSNSCLSSISQDDGGSSITRYEADCSADNGSNWSSCDSDIAPSGSEGSAFTTTIADMNDGSYYNVRVRAVNAVGNGDWTQSAQIAPPDTPVNVTGARSADGASIAARWSLVTGAGSYNLNYTDDGGTTWNRYASDITDIVAYMTGLDTDKAYIISVQASKTYTSGSLSTTLTSGWKDSSVMNAP